MLVFLPEVNSLLEVQVMPKNSKNWQLNYQLDMVGIATNSRDVQVDLQTKELETALRRAKRYVRVANRHPLWVIHQQKVVQKSEMSKTEHKLMTKEEQAAVDKRLDDAWGD